MKLFNIDYSLKNIPTTSITTYLTEFVNKLGTFINNARWKAIYFEKGEKKKKNMKENYGFKAKITPPQPKSMVGFENDLYKLAKSIKFRNRTNKFQQDMKKDIQKMKKCENLLIKADKTSNIYEIEPNKYKKMLRNNITANYKKDTDNSRDKINKEAAMITNKLDLDTRITIMPEPPAFITIKDHKEHFPNEVKCRLINPAKSEVGKISKHYLQDFNETLRIGSSVRQWRNTDEVLDWFNKIENKQQKQFISIDIVDFYPSITKELLDKAIKFAEKYRTLTSEQKKTIEHARKTILFDLEGKVWTKRNNDRFDVSQGANDSAEICELVGIYMLSEFSNKFRNIDLGLYRDDGLGVSNKMPGPQRVKLEKKIRKLFREWGFEITIKVGIQEVNFLDVNLNLKTGIHKPFIKDNDLPKYINTSSNHPKNIINGIPKIVNDRLSKLSSNREVFEEQKTIYQKQLKESGHTALLEFEKPKKKKRTRTRNILWFNPPYNQNVKTNIGKQFLNIIDKNFPEGHPLRKIFNRSTVKISYSCSMNMEGYIQSHNKMILKKNTEQNTKEESCNCRNKDECPLDKKCLHNNIVYRANVRADNEEKTYIGMTGDKFKTRYTNHKQSFNNYKYRNQTRLSNFVWEKKNEQKDVNIRFEIVKKARKFKPGDRSCNLCNAEKLEILKVISKENTLNLKNELAIQCPHFKQFSLFTEFSSKQIDVH